MRSRPTAAQRHRPRLPAETRFVISKPACARSKAQGLKASVDSLDTTELLRGGRGPAPTTC